MADNVAILDANNRPVTAATQALDDLSEAPKVAILDGSGSHVPISPPVKAQFPPALGSQSPGSSISVTMATDDVHIGSLTETAPASDTASSGLNGRMQRIAQRLTSLIALIPAALGSQTSAGSLSVTIASDDAKFLAPATGTQSNVSASVSDVTILAANTARKGAMVFNDSTALLYLLLASGTSSSSLYTVQLAPGAYYELPLLRGGIYTGVIKGIWASATGTARVTELT